MTAKPTENPTPQWAPALALVELLREHSDIPGITRARFTVEWDTLRVSLTTAVPDDQMRAVLDLCAARFGGEIRPAHEWLSLGVHYLAHEVTTTWLDVPLVISGGVPVSQPVQVSA